MQTNPYEAPKAPIDEVPGGDQGAGVEKIASGQKLVIYAILLHLSTYGLQLAIGPIAGVASIGAAIMSIVGIVRIGDGMGFPTPAKVFLGITMFIPCANLVTLLVLNTRATTALKNAGYRVGLLGASKP